MLVPISDAKRIAMPLFRCCACPELHADKAVAAIPKDKDCYYRQYDADQLKQLQANAERGQWKEDPSTALMMTMEVNGAILTTCGHTFSAAALITHMAIRDIRCPLCRQGRTNAKLSVRATFGNLPWVDEIEWEALAASAPDPTSMIRVPPHPDWTMPLVASVRVYRPEEQSTTTTTLPPSLTVVRGTTVWRQVVAFVLPLEPNTIPVRASEFRAVAPYLGRARYRTSEASARMLNDMVRPYVGHAVRVEIRTRPPPPSSTYSLEMGIVGAVLLRSTDHVIIPGENNPGRSHYLFMRNEELSIEDGELPPGWEDRHPFIGMRVYAF